MDNIGRNASSSNIHPTDSASKLEEPPSPILLSYIASVLSTARSELPNICDELVNVATSSEQQIRQIQDAMNEQSHAMDNEPTNAKLFRKYTQYNTKTNHPDLAQQIDEQEARVLEDIDRMDQCKPGSKESSQANFQFRKDVLKLNQLKLEAITTSMRDLTQLTQGLQTHLPKHN